MLGALQGTSISLSDYEGKIVFLFFYGAGCPHCLSNGGNTENEIYQAFKSDTNFVALGLDTWNNSVSVNNSFRSTTQITYPLLLNTRATGNTYFNYFAYDRAVVINSNGQLIYKGNSNLETSNGEINRVKNAISDALSEVSTSSEKTIQLPTSVQLNQNYPNPFNPSTNISFTLQSPSFVKIEVYSLLGKTVATLVDGYEHAGEHSITWNATNLPSGVYIYRLSTSESIISKHMILIK